MAEFETHPDDLFPDLASFITMMGEPVQENSEDFFVDEMTVDLPVELQIRQSGEGISIGASAPTQQVATTFLPVWHRMRITIGRVPDE